MSTGLRARKGAYAHSMYNVQWINRSIDFSFPWALHVIKQFIVQYLLILLKLFTDPIYVCWMPFEMLFPNIWHHRCNFQMKGLFRWKRNNRGLTYWDIGLCNWKSNGTGVQSMTISFTSLILSVVFLYCSSASSHLGSQTHWRFFHRISPLVEVEEDKSLRQEAT